MKARTKDSIPIPGELRGQPITRRQKTYAAESGHVYQYYFLGLRKSVESSESATEYLFEVLGATPPGRQVSVSLKDGYLRDWESWARRDLSSSERYGIAKMCLFEYFEDHELQRYGVYVAQLELIYRAASVLRIL